MLAPGVPVDEAIRRDQCRNAFEEGALAFLWAGRDHELADCASLVGDRDGELGAVHRPRGRSNDEVIAFHKADPDRGVVVDAVMENGDNLAKDVICVPAPVEHPFDGCERAAKRVRGRHAGAASSTSSPSKLRIRST